MIYQLAFHLHSKLSFQKNAADHKKQLHGQGRNRCNELYGMCNLYSDHIQQKCDNREWHHICKILFESITIMVNLII